MSRDPLPALPDRDAPFPMLDRQQRARLLELFADGSELPADQQAEFVRRSCPDDPAMRRELAELLQVAETSIGDFMADPILQLSAKDRLPDPTEMGRGANGTGAADAPPPPLLPDYTDLEPLATGGMGTVYRARQIRPVRRTVAIKAIRPGMDCAAVLARFETERQALALMAHPGIAAVYDAGTDADGRPYVTMEFVDGRPITEVCRAEDLGLDERLALFVRVCHAVDHAHRRGVLHRDLKPGNVLVARLGDEWAPKVIDFGIAKALAEPLVDGSSPTRHGGFVGTPEYMSPEQVDGSPAAVDTRSDVYSLGVMLYELITGCLPHTVERAQDLGLVQWATRLRDESTPKPSTRVREAARRPSATGTPRIDGVTWQHRLPGDLDWIVMRALEKDPDRRYGSPHELAAEVVAFLEHRPVVAGPPGGFYLVRKFARRHRVELTAAALVLLSLVLGLFGTLHYLFQSQANEAAAEARAREAEGIRIATDAALLAEESPDVALLLAIEASRLTDDDSVHRTIHRTLPLHRLAAVVEGNDHDVGELEFLPDGRLVVGPVDAVVLVADPETGAVLQRLTGHTDVVTDLEVHPAGQHLLTASMDGTARLWDLESGSSLFATTPQTSALHRCGFSPDGATFLTTALDGSARLHDARDGTAHHVLDTGAGGHPMLSWQPNGHSVATCSRSGVVRIWDPAAGALRAELHVRNAVPDVRRVLSFSLAPGGDRIASLVRTGQASEFVLLEFDGAVRLRLPATWQCTEPGSPRILASAPGHWWLVDVENATVLEHRTVPDLKRVVGTLPESGQLVATDTQRDLCLLDPNGDGTLRKLRGESDKLSGSFSIEVEIHPDGRRFAINGSRARVWREQPEFATFHLHGVPETRTVESLAVGDEALVLLRDVTRDTPTWELWSGDRRQLRGTFAPPGVQRLWLAPDGSHLVGTSWERVDPAALAAPRLLVMDLDGLIVHDEPLEPGHRHLPRPDGRAVLQVADASDAARTAHVFDLDHATEISSLQVPRGSRRWTGGPYFDHLVYNLGSRSRTEVFDVSTGARTAVVTGPDGIGHYGAEVSGDGRYLLSILGSRRAFVYDLTTNDPGGAPLPVADYTDLVRSNTYSGGFTTDGRLAWATCSNEVHVFEAATGRPFTVLQLATDVGAVACRPNGSELLTVTVDGQVQRWPLDPVAVARRIAVGRLDRRQLDQFGIGTAAEREAREIEGLQAVPRVRNHARLGELAYARGDLDGAIEAYLAATALGPLRPADGERYRRLLELLCERLGRSGNRATRQADLDAAFQALGECIRCGHSAEQVRALPGIDVLVGLPRFDAMLGR